jgi:hypothetical protein
LINRSRLDPDILRRYEAEGIFLLHPTDEEIAEIAMLGVRPIVRDLAEGSGEKRTLWNKQDTVRHDPEALRVALGELMV